MMGNFFTVKQGSLQEVRGEHVETTTIHGVVVVIVMVARTPVITGRTRQDAKKAYDACVAAARTQRLIDVTG